MALSHQEICQRALEELQPRTRDIVARRFGLRAETPQTLESIGSSYGITRERVRQVTDEAVRGLRKTIFSTPRHRSVFMPAFRSVSRVLKKEGMVKREDLLIDALNARDAQNHAIFLLVVGPEFHYHRETQDVHAFWALREDLKNVLPLLINELAGRLAKERRMVSPKELETIYAALHEKHCGRDIPLPLIRSALEVSKRVAKSHEGEWGLRSWPEVHPKGIREKAFVVLKKEGKPLHFSQVARRIEDLQRVLAFLKEKPVLPQTVHNELIKDPRFVLVGRGMYGLSDWGYREGTIKDVVKSILKDHAGGLAREELVKSVLSQRDAKETTILLALNDRSLFSKDDQGRYHLV